MKRLHAQGALEKYSKHPDNKKTQASHKAVFEAQIKGAEHWDMNANDPEIDDDRKAYSLVKKANALSTAARFAPTLKLTSELLEKARDAAEKAWATDKDTCKRMKDFSGENYNGNLTVYLEHEAT